MKNRMIEYTAVAIICILIGAGSFSDNYLDLEHMPVSTPKPEINKGDLNLSGEIVNNRVNIAVADIAVLDTVYGIGETYAKRIVEYRMEKPFRTVEDIMKVAGIGEGRFEKMKDSLILD